jgi:hypothetical protein
MIGEFTTDEKIAEIKRELAMRNRVYPRMVAKGQMTTAQSMHRVAVLAAVMRDYEAKAADGPLFNQAVADGFETKV